VLGRQCFAAGLWPKKWKFAEGVKIHPVLLRSLQMKICRPQPIFGLLSAHLVQNLYELERNAEQTYESLVLHCKLKL
jgi:hypothetical protein